MADLELEQLFRTCDTKGTGHIGPEEFRDLCAEFEISGTESRAIFEDLDHDGDGRVSLQDFAWGFRDFLTPGSRRGSMQVGDGVEAIQRQADMERRHSQARMAWAHLVQGVGESTVKKFLQTSGDKLAELYQELQITDTSPQIVSHFEGVLSSLLHDVKNLQEENSQMEEMFNKEKESHLAHLRNLEEELDAQVARVEAQAREEARSKFEAEKKVLQQKMSSEMAELQAHLKLFQKVNMFLTKGRNGSNAEGGNNDERRGEAKKKLDETTVENRELRHSLADTRTNLALLRSEMAQLRAEYEGKCRQLHSQQETVMEYMHQYDHVHRQLKLLHEANTKLQDTNDSLLTVMDVSGLRSPRPSSPCCCSRTSSMGSGQGPGDHGCEGRKRKRISQPHSRTPSEVGSLAESVADSNRSPLVWNHSRTGEEVQFGIQRLMEDLDSGRSTLRDPADLESDKSLQEELLGVSNNSITEQELDTETENDIDQIELDSPPSLEVCYKQEAAENETRKQMCQNITTVPPPKPVRAADLLPTGSPDRTYKVVFAGDAAVGKSCFIHRFCKGVFVNNLGSTLGVDFQVKTIRVDSRNVALQLWDTAGQERFRSITKTYFRRADGVLLLYDVTSERSYLNVRQWVMNIDEATEKKIPIVLCGNKLDLREPSIKKGMTCIDTKKGEQLARDYGAIFLETSSKSGANVLDAIVLLSREMLTREDVEVQTSALRITQGDEKKSSCCGKK